LNKRSGALSTVYSPNVADPSHLVSRQALIRRFVRNGALVGSLILVALGVGAAGYHFLDDLPWLDAALNAAMILTGMGPVNPIRTPAAKVFAIVYALLSGVFFLTMVAVLLSPALHHFLHRFHFELSERDQAGGGRRTPRGAADPPPTID
jgi:hypothetical protein